MLDDSIRQASSLTDRLSETTITITLEDPILQMLLTASLPSQVQLPPPSVKQYILSIHRPIQVPRVPRLIIKYQTAGPTATSHSNMKTVSGVRWIPAMNSAAAHCNPSKNLTKTNKRTVIQVKSLKAGRSHASTPSQNPLRSTIPRYHQETDCTGHSGNPHRQP